MGKGEGGKGKRDLSQILIPDFGEQKPLVTDIHRLALTVTHGYST